MKKWEYHTVSLKRSGNVPEVVDDEEEDTKLRGLLNMLGEDGWEAFAATSYVVPGTKSSKSVLTILLKRSLQEGEKM